MQLCFQPQMSPILVLPRDKNIYRLVLGLRSVLEYSCSVWDPHLDKDISQVEKIQRSAARFVKNDYSRHSSVTEMMKELNWKPLHTRRRENRLALMFKIINNLVAIPADNYISFNTRETRNKHSMQIKVKSPNIDCYKYSFLPRTIIDWNSLNQEEVNCQSLDSFKAVRQCKI